MSMTWTEFIGVSEPNAHLSVPINKAQYEEIYRKAFKTGMTAAARLRCNLNRNIPDSVKEKYDLGIEQFAQAILTARDNKTAI